MGRDGWWDWQAESSRNQEQGGMTEGEMRVAIEDLAQRCVVIDNLAANVTHHTVRTALGQFGTVLGIKLVINPLDMKFVGAAIVEMENKDQREEVVRELKEYLFMIGAIPRPSRAIPATPLLLLDHPWRRNPNILKPRLVSRTAPDAEYMRERERLQRLHADDDSLLQRFMEDEEIKLARLQESQFQEAMEKLNMIAREQKAGIIPKVKKLHNIGP